MVNSTTSTTFSEGPERISVVILGDGGTGKSCITMRLVRSQWVEEYDPTIEDSYSTIREVDGQTYYLDLVDTAGQEEYRGLLGGLWQAGNAADAYLLVYDVTSPDTLAALDEFDDLISNAQEINHSPHAVPPVKAVAGNKCDLIQTRAVTAAQGLSWARKHGCAFMETSALMSVNIEETFAIIIRRVMENRKLQRKAIEQERVARDELAAQAAAAVGAPSDLYVTEKPRPPPSPSLPTQQTSPSSSSSPVKPSAKDSSVKYATTLSAAEIDEKKAHQNNQQRRPQREQEEDNSSSGRCCIIL
ncbi:P-loop containing nucleoside triphosphate hydrolase protein [Lipomyces japonicus]|uniref:P-loop containing nucleoside triphosphate hydrolase protein n=1 Tax=Lipomyces japonicus TaxID=56871 RepID=UPI0034CF56BD